MARLELALCEAERGRDALQCGALPIGYEIVAIRLPRYARPGCDSESHPRESLMAAGTSPIGRGAKRLGLRLRSGAAQVRIRLRNIPHSQRILPATSTATAASTAKQRTGQGQGQSQGQVLAEDGDDVEAWASLGSVTNAPIGSDLEALQLGHLPSLASTNVLRDAARLVPRGTAAGNDEAEVDAADVAMGKPEPPALVPHSSQHATPSQAVHGTAWNRNINKGSTTHESSSHGGASIPSCAQA